MPPYLKLGSVPRKRHIAHKHDPGYHGEGIYYEEVVTTAGFSRAYSICYHLRPPTRVRKIEPAGGVTLDTVPEPALRHHHLKSGRLPTSGDPIMRWPLPPRRSADSRSQCPKRVASCAREDFPLRASAGPTATLGLVGSLFRVSAR